MLVEEACLHWIYHFFFTNWWVQPIQKNYSNHVKSDYFPKVPGENKNKMKPQNHMKPPNLAFGWFIGEVEISHKNFGHFRRRLPPDN